MTNTELVDGKVVAINCDDGKWLISLHKYTDWRGERGLWFAKVVPHVSASGALKQEPGGVFDSEFTKEDWETYYVPELTSMPCAIVKVKAHTNETDSHTWYALSKGAAIHVAGENGGTLCGTQLKYENDKGRRWDPWLKMWKAPRKEASVFLPTFQEPTCKRCSQK